MDEAWYSKIESDVFTQVTYMLKDRADAPYPNLHCTSATEQVNPAQFPTLLLHELAPVETGQDLDNVSVNAVIHTVEAQVWTNMGRTECKNILTVTLTELKRMRYNIVMFPTIKIENGISWGAIRARRIIGAGDTL